MRLVCAVWAPLCSLHIHMYLPRGHLFCNRGWKIRARSEQAFTTSW